MRFCGGCGGPLGNGSGPLASADAHDGAQRRHMTAMFCDMVDSTPLAERLDPEDFRELLRAYRQACVRAVERFDGHRPSTSATASWRSSAIRGPTRTTRTAPSTPRSVSWRSSSRST